jgi:hypothetical protein
MVERDLIEVFVSITILDHALACHMEPRAAAPKRRIETLQRLSNAEIPTGVMFAPVIPMLNDSELGQGTTVKLYLPQGQRCEEPSIDLLFVDIVLAGGMSGVELAAEAKRRHAYLKVLYTSAYTSNAIVHQGQLDEGAHPLAKPYRKEEQPVRCAKS